MKSCVVCDNLLSAPYLVKINTVRGGADRPSLRFGELDGIIPMTELQLAQILDLYNLQHVQAVYFIS